MTVININRPVEETPNIADGLYFVREKGADGRVLAVSVSATHENKKAAGTIHYFMPDGTVLHSCREYLLEAHHILGPVSKVTFE